MTQQRCSFKRSGAVPIGEGQHMIVKAVIPVLKQKEGMQASERENFFLHIPIWLHNGSHRFYWNECRQRQILLNVFINRDHMAGTTC